MSSIAVVDYQKGNLRSVLRGLTDVGQDAFISSDPQKIAEADGIVLPGVGAFADAADYMQAQGLYEAIRTRVEEGVPFLGICLGLHLMFSQGDEGAPAGTTKEGLGLLEGNVARLADTTPDGQKVKVPHVGWNALNLTEEGREDPLFKDIPEGAYFYFTHSYKAEPADAEAVTSLTTNALEFPASVRDIRGPRKIYGLQFHPEKSSTLGRTILSNFGDIVDARR